MLAWTSSNIQWGWRYSNRPKDGYPHSCVYQMKTFGKNITCDDLQDKQISHWACASSWSSWKFSDR